MFWFPGATTATTWAGSSITSSTRISAAAGSSFTLAFTSATRATVAFTGGSGAAAFTALTFGARGACGPALALGMLGRVLLGRMLRCGVQLLRMRLMTFVNLCLRLLLL
jgi:hypothetical protein